MKERLPVVPLDAVIDQVQSRSFIRCIVAGDRSHFAGRYWKHRGTVFTKKYGPIDDAVGLTIFNGATDNHIAQFVRLHDLRQPILRSNTMVFGNNNDVTPRLGHSRCSQLRNAELLWKL